MSNTRVTRIAITNNQRYQADKYRYGAVDGRCYQTESPLAPPTSMPTQQALQRLRKQEQMSMIEIYRMELFLKDGKRPPKKVAMKSDDRNRIIEEYGLSYDAGNLRYLGDYEKVWELMAKKYPDIACGYKSYKECQYAVKYGAQPCSWSAAK